MAFVPSFSPTERSSPTPAIMDVRWSRPPAVQSWLPPILADDLYAKAQEIRAGYPIEAANTLWGLRDDVVDALDQMEKKVDAKDELAEGKRDATRFDPRARAAPCRAGWPQG